MDFYHAVFVLRRPLISPLGLLVDRVRTEVKLPLSWRYLLDFVVCLGEGLELQMFVFD